MQWIIYYPDRENMRTKQQIGLLLVLAIFGTLVAFFIAETLRETIITFTMVLFSILLCIMAHRSGGLENRFRQSEKLYQTIFEGAGEGILLADPETIRFHDANRTICEMLGYSRDEILGMSVRDIHPKNELARVISEFQAQARGDKVLASNIPCLRKGGGIIYADIRATKVTINNQSYNIGFFSDVTARFMAEQQLQASEQQLRAANQQLRASEQQLRAANQQLRASEQQLRAANQQLKESQKKYQDLAETISDWVWEVDARGVYTYISPRVKEILGYEPEEIIGKSPFDLMPPEEARRITEMFRSLVENKQAIVALENVNLHKNGHQVVLETSGLPFLDAEGNLKGYRGVDRDITGRKRADEQLKATNEELQITRHHLERTIKELERADQTKNQFLANMSHELRTPINAIIGFTDLLLEDDMISPAQEKDLERISVNTQHLLRLIDDILDLSRIEAGKIKLAKESVDIVPLCGKVVGDFKNEADKKRIQFKNLIRTPLARVFVDPDRIREILANLVSNALKYTKEGGKVTLSAEQKKDVLEISVTDTGIGISHQYLDKIFERFQRVPGVVPGAGGTGLGLTICRELLSLHNGKIWVESEVDKGSKFTFSLPIS